MIILRNSQYSPKFSVSYKKYVYGDILDRGYLVEFFPLKQMYFTRIFLYTKLRILGQCPRLGT